jgi:hypothetical protein
MLDCALVDLIVGADSLSGELPPPSAALAGGRSAEFVTAGFRWHEFKL